MFRRLVRLGSFSAFWRKANDTLISEGPPSSDVANYWPISIRSVLSKVLSIWCRFVSDDLWKAVVCFQPVYLFERSGYLWCTFVLVHTLQSALESWQEPRIVQIDFSAAIYTVNHQGILCKLCSVCIGGPVLSLLTQFLSNRWQHVMGDGCGSKLVKERFLFFWKVFITHFRTLFNKSCWKRIELKSLFLWFFREMKTKWLKFE